MRLYHAEHKRKHGKYLCFSNLRSPGHLAANFFLAPDEKNGFSTVSTSETADIKTASCFSLRTHKRPVARVVGPRHFSFYPQINHCRH